jgi:hypothetical protein
MVFLYYYQKHLVFFPTRSLTSDPSAIGLDFKTVILDTKDHEKLHGWYIPDPNSQDVLLFLHGNAGNISDRISSIQRFRELGLNIFIFDYRGYGQSTGNVSEKGTYNDAQAAWTYLTTTRSFRPDQIVVHGRSLGGGVAGWVAEKYEPKALILESTFTSIDNIGKETYPFFPVRWLSRIHYNTIDRLKNINCPVLIIHSPEDEVIPYKHGLALYEAAKEPKSFLDIKHDHGDGFLFSKSYVPGMRDFLSTLPNQSN